jgi:hypothetical protein
LKLTLEAIVNLPFDLNDPIAVLVAVADAFERAGIESAAYGGLALAVYGEARETRDADLAVVSAGVDRSAEALRDVGFNVRPAFDRVRFGGQLVSRLTLVGGAAGSLNTADLVEPRSPRYARNVISRALTGPLRDRPVRVVSPEDFVMLKVLASRDRDLEDAANVLLALSTRLDLALIERELAALAAEITDHDIVGRWRAARQIPG